MTNCNVAHGYPSRVQQTISVIGLGYLGLTHAVTMTELGCRVLGYDSDSEKIAGLLAGRAPFFEPDLDDLLAKALNSGNLVLHSEPGEWLGEANAHFLCVGTPSGDEDGKVDLSQIMNALNLVLEFASQGTLIVGRSTTPAGTANKLNDEITKSNKNFELAWNPEFLSEGTAVSDSFAPSRLVFGFENPTAGKKLKTIYKPLIDSGVPVVELDWATSELVKVASNAYLALKISFINAIASVAEQTGASTSNLADVLGMDERIGRKFLNNGLGFGGGCLPKDILGLSAQASVLGLAPLSKLLNSVSEINYSRVERVVDILTSELGQLEGKRVGLLGVSFKPNTDDIRESQVLKLNDLLTSRGVSTIIHDPVAMGRLKLAAPDQAIASTIQDAFKNADAIVIGTEWHQYKALLPSEIHGLADGSLIIDARNVIQESLWQQNGWKVIRLGEPT